MIKINQICERKKQNIVEDLHDLIVIQEIDESQAKADIIFIHNIQVSKKNAKFWRELFAEMWALELPSVNRVYENLYK